MNDKKQIVIFSHGMGVMKDSRGLFTKISEHFEKNGIKTILFNYNSHNPETNEVTIKSFSEQTKILKEILDKTIKENPKSEINIIAHSQGAIMVSLLKDIKQVKKVVLLAPFFHTDIEDVKKRHNKEDPESVDFTKPFKRKRSDGTTTIITPEYWQERFQTPVTKLYNELAKNTELTIINASEDEIMKITNLNEIYNTSIINIKAVHDFPGKVRDELKKLLLKIILNNIL